MTLSNIDVLRTVAKAGRPMTAYQIAVALGLPMGERMSAVTPTIARLEARGRLRCVESDAPGAMPRYRLADGAPQPRRSRPPRVAVPRPRRGELSPTDAAIISAARALGDCTAAEVAAATGLTACHVGTRLGLLSRRGLGIVRLGSGRGPTTYRGVAV